MRKILRGLPALLAGLLLLPALATAQAPAKDDVLRATLPNGLRVVIVPDRLAPVVTTEINYLVGSNEAPAGFPGTAHALEHMMFRGSPGLSKDQLSAIAAAMGGGFNADTTQTVTQYFFTVPAADLDVALHIESLRMRGLDAAPAQWAKERGAIEQEVSRDLSSPQYVFYSQLLATMFKGTPYAHDALGTRPSFDKTSAAMLRQFHQTWYVPNNAILVIAGDVDPAAALARVRTLFGDIPSRPLPARPAVDLQPVSAQTLKLPTDLPVGLVAVSYRMPGMTARDYAASLILSDVLGSQRGSLYALVPQGKALFAGFQYAAFPGAGLGFAIGAFPKGGDAQALLADINSTLAATLKHGVPADLVAAAKRNAIARLEFQKNSISGLANAWSSALAFEGLDSPDAIKGAIEAVTVADVDRVARAALDPQHAITAILTPQSSGKPIAGKGFGGAESFGGAPEGAVKLPVWAERALARLEVPTSTVRPTVTTLANGIRLIVQPESVSDTVQVYGAIRSNADLQTPPGQEGVGSVLGGLFEYGTQTLDRLAYLKALDDISASVNAGTSFSLAVPAAHFARGMALLADDELHPALPPQAFAVVQMQTARALAGELESPGYLYGRAITKALVPANDPTLREATPQGVMKLTLADVKAYHAAVYRPDMTTIVVIGKVTPAEAERVVTQAFGDWKAQGPKPVVELAPIPLNASSQAVVPDTTSLQDSVALVQNLGLNLKSPDRYALNLGNQVLGGGFYASRLYRDLREKSGLVYTVGTAFDWGLTRSRYSVSYGCDPDKVSQARALVVRDLRQMQEQPVTPTELTRAKALLIRSIPLGESSTGSIAGRLLYYAQVGLPLDEPTRAAKRYLALTAPEVQAAFKAWVRPGHLATVVKGPAPK